MHTTMFTDPTVGIKLSGTMGTLTTCMTGTYITRTEITSMNM